MYTYIRSCPIFSIITFNNGAQPADEHHCGECVGGEDYYLSIYGSSISFSNMRAGICRHAKLFTRKQVSHHIQGERTSDKGPVVLE